MYVCLFVCSTIARIWLLIMHRIFQCCTSFRLHDARNEINLPIDFYIKLNVLFSLLLFGLISMCVHYFYLGSPRNINFFSLS